MSLSRPLLSAHFFCQHCKKETKFLPIHFALAVTGIARRTMYYWMEHDWIHWRTLPSGRRVICEESLNQQGAPRIHIPAKKITAKVSNSEQSGTLTPS